MSRDSLLLLILAVVWAVTAIGVVLLLRRASALLAEERTHRRQLLRCLRGDHLDTLDTKFDGLPKLAWRCLACGERVVLGVAYATGSNKRTRRARPA